MRQLRGLSLIEMLVALVLLSILASVAMPYAEITVRRQKELELRQALREIRTALDAFHGDWKAGRIARSGSHVSELGYPVSLEVLVDGVEGAGAEATRRRYLRRIPRDPFADQTVSPSDHWITRSYEDGGSSIWGGDDVYDVHSGSELEALNGTKYSEW